MSMFPSGYTVLLDSGSTSTSSWWWVGDFRLLSMSYSSRGSLGPSRLTVEGSNADGFQQADLPSSTSPASLISGINLIGVTPGMVTFDPPGFRWIRVTTAPANHSVASALTVIFAGGQV
jgi:hypothetical protein